MNPPSRIEQLQNLPLPEPVSYLPQTWGWWVLLLMLLGLALLQAARRYRHWRRNRYRRAALAELAGLEQRLHGDPQRLALRELPALLKRTALALPGQPAVASLGGAHWQAFLQRHCRQPLPADFSAQLASLAYAAPEQLQRLDEATVTDLLGTCRRWLEQHHVAA